MLTDPRRLLAGALAFLALPLGWFLALAVASDALFQRFGMGMHAVTFLSIFLACAFGVAALIFLRFATVKSELLAGRRVVGAWRVDEATMRQVAPKALAADDEDKRGALLTIWIFLALIFGGFALFDHDAAPAMLTAAAGFGVVMGFAYLLGRRTAVDHWRWRGGEAILGERGLIFNGVLHVWAVPLSWLAGARATTRPAAVVVAYRVWTRAGPQTYEAVIPVPSDATEAARAAVARLNQIARG